MNSNIEVCQTNIWSCFRAQSNFSTDTYYQNQLFINNKCNINTIIEKYCLCDVCISTSNINHFPNQPGCMEMKSMNETQLNEYSLSIGSTSKIIMVPTQFHKRRLLDTIDFQQNIEALLSTIKRVTNEGKVVVHGKRKSTARLLLSNRRSHYTGVFKNGDNWQALISIQKRKTYIGTYTNELEAAKVFDFYSILLNGITATTNFDYTKMDIVEMIENYISNDRKYIKLQ